MEAEVRAASFHALSSMYRLAYGAVSIEEASKHMLFLAAGGPPKGSGFPARPLQTEVEGDRDTRPKIAALRILIVEDEVITAIELESYLEDLGHIVVGIAGTAPDALAAAEQHRPDLILMDIRLAQGGDGVEVATELRRRYDLPSVFLTAHADGATRERADAARPVGYLSKPVPRPEFSALLARLAASLRR
jgi:CheY-like chemotaxis protein